MTAKKYIDLMLRDLLITRLKVFKSNISNNE
mgnify:CR=1 FL=1